ncbi:MAG: rhodanese-like domain-containing protein [Candidatus Kapabacteria bacterium]|nr:rhodanese-like domain-containing protein [Candidatus Kapabacteria bacterium]MDW8011861.1 rhodanese-like domain-containing protein [Bacteroidota bacterium]
MFFRLLYDEALAQASYFVGCEATGEALVVDPTRDVDRYLELASQHGFRITAVTETHIHADFLSGTRELAERTGAAVYLSGAGTPDWQYRWATTGLTLLQNGDTFRIGHLLITALHTPGHTPEHLCFALTDRGVGATHPVGVFTGDFLFVGDVGRPDLLESAVGQRGVARQSAEVLFDSLAILETLPDFVQVWPGHGAGSACGKTLGAIPQSTIGYERRYNPALQITDRTRFVEFVLQGQPDPPLYFARMKRLNRDGVPILGNLPQPRRLTLQELRPLLPEVWVVDTRSWGEFQEGHLEGSIFAPLTRAFPTVVASYVPEDAPVVLILPESLLLEAIRQLVRVGVDRIVGYVEPHHLSAANGLLQSLPTVTVDELSSVRPDSVVLVDVRNHDEYAAGHIPGALHAPYARLPEHRGRLPKDAELIVYCYSGERSAYAAALLQRYGFRVRQYAGGFREWALSGGPVER